jgi:hypothetical protein
MKAITANTLGIIMVAAITLLVFLLVFPNILNILLQEAALTSPTVVARELSGYIAISGAAPHEIQIFHSTKKSFNVKIDERVVLVELAEKTGIGELGPVKSTIPIDLSADISNANFFTIKKSEGKYEINGKKIGEFG